MDNSLIIALSKGRIFKETVPLLAQAGIVPVDDPDTSRKLILDTKHLRTILIRERRPINVGNNGFKVIKEIVTHDSSK